MTPLTRLTGIAAALPQANIDTDKILPARFLKTVGRAGLGAGLFADLREDPGFTLNREPWNGAQILIALENFGCGSSREHAPWALLDFGIRCVIAPSFADIFQGNCFKNGMLPLALPYSQVETLLDLASKPETAVMTVDLPGQFVRAGGEPMRFEIDPLRKSKLISGVDEIAVSLGHEADIASFERSRAESEPWLA